jgi:beta-glucosidase/6-phospho-beta-glucosidase/beta-galactosidase
LIKIDYENNFRREPRVSAGVYSKIIEENAVSSELFEKYAKKNGSDSVM